MGKLSQTTKQSCIEFCQEHGLEEIINKPSQDVDIDSIKIFVETIKEKCKLFSDFIDAKNERKILFDSAENKLKFDFSNEFYKSLGDKIDVDNIEKCMEICLEYINDYEDTEKWKRLFITDRRSTRR